MSMCSVSLRARRSGALLDGCDSSSNRSPAPAPALRDSSSPSPRQRLLVGRSTSSSGGKRRSLRLKSFSRSSPSKRRAIAGALERSVSMPGRKLSKMRSIVRHWKKLARVSSSSSTSPSSIRQKRRYLSLADKITGGGEREPDRKSNFGGGDCFFGTSATATLSDLDDGDGDDGGEESPERSVRRLARAATAGDVPEGCLALFVGRERRRFVVGAHYLEHNLFRGLLERSAAEFGFDQKGGIRIACEVVLFEHLLWLIGTDDPSTRHLQVDELLDFYAY